MPKNISTAMPVVGHHAAAPRQMIEDEPQLPGFYRKRIGRGTVYVDENGQKVVDKAVLHYIRSLGIPPAYTSVWISKDPDARLLATGLDAKGRKQYRYHPAYADLNNQTKFSRLARLGKVLPKLREQVNADLQARGWPRQKVLALIVFFLDEYSLRIGNKCYEKLNGSYGITTLRKKHLKEKDGQLVLSFTGKSGVTRQLTIGNKKLARMIMGLTSVPGHQIFTWQDEDGRGVPLTSTDVNQYLAQATGTRFTAKDFRTWKATTLAVKHFAQIEESLKGSKRLRQLVPTLVKTVSSELGNTPTVCRKYYIHPAVLKCAEMGLMHKYLPPPESGHAIAPANHTGLSAAEEAAMRIMRSPLFKSKAAADAAEV